MSKEALIVWGGWDGHTPKESADVFQPLLEEAGFHVEVRDTLDAYKDETLMGKADLIVPIWTMGQIDGEQVKGLMDAVRNGAGLAGFHGGIIDSFRSQTGYQWMTGGQWVSHPGNAEAKYTVKIEDADHEITKGLSDFVMENTEQYYMHIDPGVHVLTSTVFTGEYGDKDLYPANTVMPYAWTRQWGKGRVFVAAWGHTFKDFDVPEAKEIVRRGMLWAAR